MGANQSVPNTAGIDEQQIKQRRNYHMQGDALDQGYVHVGERGDGSTYFDGPSISTDAAQQWEKQLLANPKNKLALNALMSNNVKSVVQRTVAVLPDQQVFNVKIPLEGSPVTNQRSSGRCWLFATTNVFRIAVMKKHDLKDFELSQAYLFFWDKLEKANYFLSQVVDTVDQDLSSRLVQELLNAPVNDGGQWDMALNVVKKYGIVPQVLYPDSYNAKDSSMLGTLLTSKLREDALQLRALVKGEKASAQALVDAKAKMMQEIHTILTLMLGPPPKPTDKFKWEYCDASGKFHCVHLTPLEFSAELSTPSTVRRLGVTVNNMFSLVNDPRHAYLTKLAVSRLGNVVEGSVVSYVNVDMSTMKQAAIAMLKAGLPVWFGCDVGKDSATVSGIMDTELYDYDLAFNINLGMDKSQRLQTKESSSTHAMVLTAVHIENGKSVRWRVMNSWGDTAGSQGYFVMTDAWMDQYCYQIVTDPSHVSKAVTDVLKQDPVMLPLWDPLGALA